MSAACTPEPDDRPGPAVPGELTTRDRRILDEIAGYENGSDPGFVARLRGPARPLNPVAERLIQVAVIAGLLALVLPAVWLVIGLIVVVMLVGPALLAWYAHRLQQRGNRSPGRDAA